MWNSGNRSGSVVIMDFVHCTRCGYWPKFAHNRLEFFFSSCGRLLCQNCVSDIGGKCPCGSSQCRVLSMNQIGKDVKYLFDDPASMLQDAMKKIVSNLQFQKSLMKSFIKITGKLVESNRELKARLEAQTHDLVDLRDEKQRLFSKIETLQSRLEKTSHQLKNGAPHGIVSNNDPLNIFRADPKPMSQVPPFQFNPIQASRPIEVPFHGTPRSFRSNSSVSIFQTPQRNMISNQSMMSTPPSSASALCLRNGARSETSEIVDRLRNIRCSVQSNNRQ